MFCLIVELKLSLEPHCHTPYTLVGLESTMKKDRQIVNLFSWLGMRGVIKTFSADCGLYRLFYRFLPFTCVYKLIYVLFNFPYRLTHFSG